MARIQIADDEANMRNLVRLACQMGGHETFESLDTASTISTYLTQRPDLLILDLAMPGGGGNYVVQALGSQSDIGLCPVIIITRDEANPASYSPVIPFVVPGPVDVIATPSFPVAREYPSAACSAPCSCRTATGVMPPPRSIAS